MADNDLLDLFIIGGGINGCGIARDAAGRGYSVALAEMHDFASGTSSGSTKLIHGGLRYLEHFEFRLVREALMEREVLWAMAPHVIWPLRFVLPVESPGIRPAWLIRLGLFIYDHLGGRKLLPPTRTLDLRKDEAGRALQARFRRGFEYSDGWVDDARLVILNARDARQHGAIMLSRCEVISAHYQDDHWSIKTRNLRDGTTKLHRARMIVNAAGPWVDDVLGTAFRQPNARHVRLVKGSHIIIRKKHDDPRAYFFQNADNRIIFAIPYEDEFTLIGTTDEDFQGNPRDATISESEISYLCRAASEYFREPVLQDHIIRTYCAVRPLFDDGASKAQEATRDYVLALHGNATSAPLLNVFGGKLTTYRRLAEQALSMIGDVLGKRGAAWTSGSPLPGGDFPATGAKEILSALRAEYPFLSLSHAKRLVRCYGTHARLILGEAQDYDQLGRHFGDNLFQAEVDWLVKEEWAITSDDILWRRTKQGLFFNSQQIVALQDYLDMKCRS